MNKIYTNCIVVFVIISCFVSTNANAQTFTIAGGTSGSHLYNLVYTWYQAPRTQRMATHIPSAQIAAGGLVPGASITSLELERLAGNTLELPAGANMKIYLENQPSSSLDLGVGTLTWATIIAGATLVYDGDPSIPLSNSPGWKEFPFGTGPGTTSSFIYTGGALVVFSDYIHTTAIGGTTAIPMMYATAAEGTPTPNGWTTNSTKYSNNSTTTPPTTIATSTANHPHMRFTYSTGPCTSPPTPGTTTALPSTPVCSGSAVLLNLTGNSTGTGQTYVWESSSTLGGTYLPISGSLSSSNFIINPTASMFYRAAVTCNGNTEYSDTLQVIVNPAFPGGTYTIGPSGDYLNFTSAVNALSCGIAGPVVFNVDAASGPYTEQITIPVIAGTSSTNTVTINGNGRTLQFTPVTSARHVLKLDGADYVTINNLNIVGLATDFDWGIHLTNGADNNTINNCTIDLTVNTSTTQSNSAGIVASGSSTSVTSTGNNASNLTVSGCTILGGYQGIILNGFATGLNAVNNTITNNTIQDTYGNGIELVHNDGAIVSGNDISRPTRTNMLSTSSGIEIGVGSRNVTIDANKIHDTHTSVTTQTGTAYGIYFNACDAPGGSENLVTNNLIYNFNSGSGTQYGLYNINSDGVYYYHNTVVLDNASSTAGTTYAFYQTTLATNIRLINNILFVTRGGTGLKNCMRFNTTTSTILSNNNVLYINSGTGTVGVGYYGANFVTLADWQTANSNAYDQASVDHNPLFASISNYTPTNGLVDNIGANVGVATDIMGNSRTLASPDPGAYEWNAGVDLVPPAISYTILSSTSSTTNRSLTATITDLSGVQTGTNGPRLYYKKSTDVNYVFDSNPTISGDDYTFTIDYTLLGGVVPGNTIQYYVAAQDIPANVATNPSGGSGTNPPGTIAPGAPNTYSIIPVLTGTYLIGTGETYEKLTNLANALNNNLVEIGGNVVFEFTSNYDGTTGETLPINFNEFLTTDPNWTVTVRPGTGVTNRITSGDPGTGVGVSVINFSGGDRYIFDGRPGGIGSQNEWTIRNTRTTATIGSVIRFVDDATNNVIRNLNIESQATSTTTGAIFLNTAVGGTTGNSFNSILSNNIRGIAGLSISNGIYSTGTALAPNSDNTISGNNIYDFGSSGISITATGNGPNWVITDNNIYNSTSSALTQNGIIIASANATNTTVSGNSIGGNAPGATGIWTNTGNVVVTGITVSNGIVNVLNNTIANIAGTSTGTTARIRGILISSTLSGLNILNNTINNLSTTGTGVGVGFNSAIASGITIAPSGVYVNDTIVGNTISNISIESTAALTSTNIATGIALINLNNGVAANNLISDIKNKTTGTTAGQPPVAAGITNNFGNNSFVVNNMINLGATENTNTQFAGLWQASVGTGNTHHYYHNTVLVSGTSSGDRSSYGFVRGLDTSTLQNMIANVRNNIFAMTRSGGGSVNYAIGNRGPVAGSGWISDYNNLYNADPLSIGFWNATGYDFAGWKTASGADANSVSLQPFFVSATDLHLDPLNAGNQVLDDLGTPISGITTDIDNQTRSLTTPDMGADEFTFGVVVPVTVEFFRGNKQTGGNLLDWKVSCSGSPYAILTLERSANGRSFIEINTEQASSLRCLSPFSYVDATPLPGINYYRLKMTDADGKTTYSHLVVIINKEKGFEIVGLNPNPVYTEARLNLSSAKSTKIEIHITDNNGRLLQRQSAQIQSGSNLVPLKVSSLAAGSYQVTVITEENEKTTLRFIKQ